MRFLQRNKKSLNTKVFDETDFSVLDYEQLLKVNGAGGGSSGGSSGSSGSSSSSSGPSSSSSSSASDSPSGSSSGGKGNSQTSTSDKNSTQNTDNTPTSQNIVDNTKNPTIVNKFTGAGYELLSDKKDEIYTEGSRKEYIQSEFEEISSDKDSFTVVKLEGRFEGVSDGTHSYNDYDQYTVIGKDGKTYMEAIDINKDGKIDYVK